ncbi:hypothetical protein [Stieleria varia]|uniref:Chromosome partition protein Smc n=1 Tax=Stieleria varia TaxID=2528005 RepID=A0A5C6B8M2_9BACT|nr:hypothetical protein [Stieleria varia]TWU07596.1 Chromosome partition protein Smc [Stieleria varia]
MFHRIFRPSSIAGGWSTIRRRSTAIAMAGVALSACLMPLASSSAQTLTPIPLSASSDAASTVVTDSGSLQRVPSTIANLKKRSEDLKQHSIAKYKEPLEAIKQSINSGVNELIHLRSELAADPTNKRKYAEFEDKTSQVLSELHQGMQTLLDGEPVVQQAIDDTLNDVRSYLEKQQQREATAIAAAQKSEGEANRLDADLQQAASKIGPLLAAGRELPPEIDVQVAKVDSSLKAARQSAEIQRHTAKRMAETRERLLNLAKSLEQKKHNLDLAYSRVADQQSVLDRLVQYRQAILDGRVQEEEVIGLREVVEGTMQGLEDIDFDFTGELYVESDGSRSDQDAYQNAGMHEGKDILLKRYEASKSVVSVEGL